MQISSATLPFAKVVSLAARWLPIRGWERLFRYMFGPDHQRPFRFPLRIPGGTIEANAAVYSDRTALLYGSIEPDDLTVARNLLRKLRPATVLDVGANVGHYSIAMAALAKTVHAFEPFPEALERLTRNVALNPSLNIVVHRVGLSDRDCELPYTAPTGNNRGLGHFGDNGSDILPLRCGDDLKLNQIGYLKIDTEGMECRVLSGLRATIFRDRPIIQVEISGNIDSVARLLPQGYSIYCNVYPSRIFRTGKLRSADHLSEGLNRNFFFVPRELRLIPGIE